MADRSRWQRGRPWGGSERPDTDAKVTYLPAVPNHLFFAGPGDLGSRHRSDLRPQATSPGRHA
jgi:hypothetical protein